MSDVVVAALEDTLAVVVREGRLDAAVGLPLVLLEMRLPEFVLPALDVHTLVELEVLELVLPKMAVRVLEELNMVDVSMVVMLAAVEELGLLVAGTVEMPEVLIATAVDDAVMELEEEDIIVELLGDEIAELEALVVLKRELGVLDKVIVLRDEVALLLELELVLITIILALVILVIEMMVTAELAVLLPLDVLVLLDGLRFLDVLILLDVPIPFKELLSLEVEELDMLLTLLR